MHTKYYVPLAPPYSFSYKSVGAELMPGKFLQGPTDPNSILADVIAIARVT